MTTIHRNLTGADLHEPKGADTATSGKVYVSDGAGSGVWTDASTIITNSAFTTGDLKLTHKTSADTSWILYAYGSIGDGSSSATVRANADTATLFALYWNSYSDTYCPVSGGRGASAAADFAAHKRLTLPDMSQRALAIAGSHNGGGLASRTLGSAQGADTFTIITANLPAYTPAGSIGGSVSPSQTIQIGGGSHITPAGGGSTGVPATNEQSISISASGLTFTGTAQGGTSTPITTYQPTAYVNVMIKL